MANLQNFSFYRDGSANVGTVPRYRVEGQIEGVNPATGGTIVAQDFTGANRLTFPAIIGTYTEEQRLGLMDLIARYMINVASGGALDQ
jgi:hypothetical protein